MEHEGETLELKHKSLLPLIYHYNHFRRTAIYILKPHHHKGVFVILATLSVGLSITLPGQEPKGQMSLWRWTLMTLITSDQC